MAGTLNGTFASARTIIFIDPRVANLQTLIDGAQPGDMVFVLDAATDGVQQIADILSANNFADLAAIHIVSHGSAGEVQLGSTFLNDGNLAEHSAALATIGSFLAADGDLLLYGCDVAAGDAGKQFIADLSSYTAADVSAATHVVGSADLGGNWTLDASTGPIEASAPFTADALTSFSGALAGTIDGQLWYTIMDIPGPAPGAPPGTPARKVGGFFNSDGTSFTPAGGTLSGTSTPPVTGSTIAVDTAAGLMFVGNSDHLTVTVYNFNTNALIETIQVGNPNAAGTLDDDLVYALAVDPINHMLFVNRFDGTSTGIVKISYDPLTGDLNNNGAYNSGSQQFLITNAGTTAAYDGVHGYTFGTAFEVDIATHKLYYTDYDSNFTGSFGGANFVGTNEIVVVSDYTAASPTVTRLTTAAQFPADGSNGYIGNMAIDDAKGLIYFTVSNLSLSNGQAALYYMPIAGGTATKISDIDNVNIGDVITAGLSLDAQSQQLYVSLAFYDPGGPGSGIDPTANANHVLKYQISADGHSLSLLSSYTLAQLEGQTPTDENSHPGASFFNQLPTLTLTGTSSHIAEQSFNTTFLDLTASNTSSDTDGAYYSNATVQITGGTFTANETSANDDHLSVNDSGTHKTSGTFTGTNITISFNSATEKLTLSGYDTIAHYNTVLAAVEYSTSGDNPTDYGLQNTRTVTWTVSDGSLNVPTGNQNSGTSTFTIDAQNDAPNVNVGGADSASIAVNETNSGINQSRSLTITDPDSLTETLTFTSFSKSGPTGGISDATLQGFFSIPATVNITQATGSASFNWTFNSGAEAFNYLPAGVTLTLGRTIHDVDSNDSNGPGSASLSDDQAISVVITGVNDAPVVTAGNAITYIENDPATTISPAATITDVDSSDFNSGSLTIGFTANGTAADQLTIQNQGTGAGQIGLSGSNVTYGGLTIGTFFGGANGANLVINFTTTDATQAAVQALLDDIQYANNSDNPSTLARTVTYTLNDGDGTANGGTNTGTATATINVTAVNDPPVNNKPGAQSVNEDAALVFNSGNGNLISITDPDAQSGNETVTLSVNHGTLTLGSVVGITFDGGTVNGTASFQFHGTLANVNTALSGLSYSATANYNGSDTLSITTNDGGNTGTGGALQDADTVAISVTAVNDAPTVINGASVSLAAIAEDATPPGVAVNSLLSTHFSDALDDQTANGGSAANNFAGVVVTANAATGGQGVWQYSTDGGSNWFAIPDVSGANDFLIAATDLIRFEPASNFNGTPGSLTVHLVDDSAGAITAGAIANVAAFGGTTRYSTGTITIGETVDAVNDAPTFTALGGVPHAAFTEGGAAVVLDADALAHDVELDALNGGSGNYANATLTLVRHGGASAQDVFGASGTLTLAAGNVNVGATTVGTFTNSGGTLAITFNSNATTTLVDNVLDQITYVNSSDAPPSSVQIDYTLNDGNSGSQGSGGALAAIGNVIVDITAANDAPDVTPNAPGAVTYVLSQASPVGLLSTGAVTDPDQPANFNGGDLTVAITAGADVGNDHLNLLASSGFTESGGTLFDGATAIGTIAGLDSDTVTVTALTSAATPTEISKLLEAFDFSSTSTLTNDRSVTYTFHDGGNVGDVAPGASDAVTQTVHVTNPVTGQLYYRINNGPDDQVGSIHADGTGRATVYATATNETSIAIDPAAGFVFTTGTSGGGQFDTVFVHNIHTGALVGAPFVVGAGDVVQSLALDLSTHTLYVSDKGSTPSTTGIKTLTYDPSTGALSGNTFLFTATQTETTAADATTAQFTNAQALYFDSANHLLYYVDDDAGNSAAKNNGVYVFDTTAAVDADGPTFNPVQLTNLTQFPAAVTAGTVGTNGNIVGLAVDVAHGVVFFETTDVANSANNQLWWVNAAGGAGQTATEITLPIGVTLNYAGDTSEGGIAAGLTFDAASQTLYLTNAYQDGAVPNLGAIYGLLWDNTNQTVSLVTTFDTATLVGTSPITVNVNDAPSVTAFDDAPTLLVTSAAATFTESATNPASANNTPVTLLSGATVGDPDGAGMLAGATVSISSGFLTGDLLSVTLTGNITVQSNAAGVLVLTGTDTFANYQTVLNSVQYTSTSENPTNYGVDNSRTITWSVTDGVLNNPTAITTTVAVAGTNDAPANTVPGATLPVNEDTALAFTGGNAISVADADNQSLSVNVYATHGDVTFGSVTNLTVSGNGTHNVTIAGATADLNAALATLSYQGDANFNGSDQLFVVTTDGIAPPTQDAVNITVTAVDDAPAGTDNAPSTPVDTPYAFNASDFGFSDPNDGAPFGTANNFAAVKITTLTLPAGATLKNGATTVNAGDTILVSDINANQLVFTPAPGAGGANYAHFTFQVVDDGANVAPDANIDPTPNLMTINVGSGFGPNVVADSYAVVENATDHENAPGVLGNDTGSNLTVTAVNGSGGNVGNSTAGTYGHLTLNLDGSLDYAADTTAAIDAAPNGTHPVDTFNYTATDDEAPPLSATTTVSFTIDRPPTLITHNVDIARGASVGPVSANDTDPDGDSFTVTAVTGGAVGSPLAGTYGSVTINSNDTYSYSANNTAAIDAVSGSHPIDTFTYTVDDGLGGTTLETLSFSVNRAPDAPVDNDPANDGVSFNGAVTEGAGADTTVGIIALASDLDADTISYSLTSSAGGFFKIDASTGVVSVTSTGATGIDFESAPAHAYSITVQANDGHGATSTQSFTIAVNDVAPSTPVDSDATGNSVIEGAAAGTLVHVTASSTDVNGGTIVYSLTNNPGGAFTINSSNGQVSVNDPSAIDYESATGHSLSITVQAATTNGLLVSTHDFSIAITNANPSTPTDADGTANSVTEGAAADTLVHVTASSTDPNGPAVTYSITSDQSSGGFKIDSSTGVVSVADATKINYETAPGHAYSITVQASDGAGGTSSQSFSIAVADVAPVAADDTYDGANAANEDQPLNIAAADGVLANDTDVNGGPLTAVLNVGPLHAASFTFNPDGSFDYTPAADFSGSDSFTYHAFDGSQSSGIATATITINSVNDAPVLTGFGDASSFTENGSSVILDTNGNASVSDVELDASPNKYEGATLTIARTGGPNADDSFAATGSLDLVDVSGTGENVSLDGGATFIGTFTNPGDGSISFTFNANATAADINSVMRQIAYANGSDNPPTSVQIDFTLSDGNGVPGGQAQGGGPTPGIGVGSFTVNITQVDDAPVLINVAPSAAYSIGSPGVVLSSGLGVFDVDATPPSTLQGIHSATVSISSGFFAGDQLFVNLPTSGGFFIVDDGSGPVVTNVSVTSNAAGTMVLGGTDTTLHYQLVLDAVDYRSTAADPTNGGTDPNRTITWQVNDGALNSQTPNPDPNNLVNATILHFDVPPAVDLDASGPGTGFTTSFTENGSAVAIADTDVSVTDPDNAALDSATIVLTNAKSGDLLSVSGALPGGIASSIDTSVAGQITLTLGNSATLADYQTALGQIRFSNTSENPDTTARDITVQVAQSQASSNIAHATVNVIAVNDAPVLAGVPATASFRIHGAPVTLAAALSVSDLDNTTLASATVHISAGTFVGDGDVLAVSAGGLAGTGISASYNAASETLTLTGVDTLAHYQQALDHVTFESTSANATNAGLNPTRTVEWQVNDGSAAHNLSTIATETINIVNPPLFDFNGDGKGDILWQNGDGTPAVWLMNGTGIASTGPALPNPNAGLSVGAPTWKEIDAGDFNGDGKADILWQNENGTPAVWLMNGTGVDTFGPALANPGPAWHAKEAADFNGDGKADILWQNDNGTPAVWLMNGVNVLSTGPALANPGPTWHVGDAADFNGDGKADILWQNDNGTPAVWLMDGVNVLSTGPALANPGPTWHEIAAGDFNGDGKADILWQNNDGTPAVWLMDGTTVLSTGPALANPGTAWHAKEAEDFNGDGKADILWQHNDGTPAVWLMNGTAVTSFGPGLLDPGASWHII